MTADPLTAGPAVVAPGSETPVRVLPLDSIVPYWRNPRVVTEEAVRAVAASIDAYGYNQPIMVDADNVIILGHTRYAALRRLGWTAAPVLVASGLTPEQVRGLRVVDNKSHEFTSWSFEELRAELADLDAASLVGFFPEAVADPDADAKAAAETAAALARAESVATEVDLICSVCFHSFTLPVTREAIFTGRLSAAPAPAAQGGTDD